MEADDWFDRFSKKLNRFVLETGWISGIIGIVITIGIAREVGGRYLFNMPSDWVVDLSGLLYASLVYLGAAYTTAVDAHVRADFIYLKYTGKTKAVMDIVIYLICIFYTAVLVWQGWSMAWEAFITKDVTTGGIRWLTYPFKLTVPLGCALVVLIFLQKIVFSLRLLLKGGK